MQNFNNVYNVIYHESRARYIQPEFLIFLLFFVCYNPQSGCKTILAQNAWYSCFEFWARLVSMDYKLLVDVGLPHLSNNPDHSCLISVIERELILSCGTDRGHFS